MTGNKERLSLMQREALFTSRKRPLQNEEGVSSFLVLLFQLTRHCLVTPRPTIPSLASVRYSFPSERVGGVLTFEEGKGLRLLLFRHLLFAAEERELGGGDIE